MPSLVFSAIYGSDLSSLPSEPEQPPEDVKKPEHPLNTLLDQLLSWFEAHYAMDSARTPISPEDSQKGAAIALVQKKKSKKVQLDQEYRAAGVYGGRDLNLNAAQILQYERLHVKLETYNAMLTLFYDLLNTREWPEGDKGRDKKPKDGHMPPKSAVPSSTVTGSKRRSMDEEPEEKPGPSKCSRT